jgi:hypothetical protein
MSSPYMNRRFGGTCHLHLQGRKLVKQETSEQQVARQNFKQDEVKVILRPTVGRPVYPGVRPLSWTRDRFLYSLFLKLSLDSNGVVNMGRSL